MPITKAKRRAAVPVEQQPGRINSPSAPTVSELVAALAAITDQLENIIDVHIYDGDEPADAPERRMVAENRALIERASLPSPAPDAPCPETAARVWLVFSQPEDGERSLDLYVDKAAANVAAAKITASMICDAEEYPEATAENWRDLLEQYRAAHDCGDECYIEEVTLIGAPQRFGEAAR